MPRHESRKHPVRTLHYITSVHRCLSGNPLIPGRKTVVSHPWHPHRWKTLLIHGMEEELPRPEHTFEGQGSSHFYHPQHNEVMQHLKGLPVSQYRALLKDPEAVRIMWVRNPYERLLSGFLDKARPGMFLSGPHYGGPYERSPEGFHRFVSDQFHILKLVPSGLGMNKHFRPQALQCGLQKGFQYDFILKADKMNEWYPDVVNMLALEGHVRYGWRYGFTEVISHACFHHSHGCLSLLPSPSPAPPPPPPPRGWSQHAHSYQRLCPIHGSQPFLWPCCLSRGPTRLLTGVLVP